MARLSSLFLLSAALAAGPAIAADLLPPPPSLEGYGQPVELGTGWYLRGDIAYVDYATPRDRGQPVIGAVPLDGERLDRAFSLGAGIGYQVNEWLRTDVTVDYRFGAEFSGMRPIIDYSIGAIRDEADLQTTAYLLNAYADLGTWHRITPYVGAGVGVATNRFTGGRASAQVAGVTIPIEPLVPQATHNLAWALMAGMAVDVGSGFKVDLGYRFTHLGDVRTKNDASNSGIQTNPIRSHEIRLGARYMID